MVEKTYTIQELKDQFSTRHGFWWKSPPIGKDGPEKICSTLIAVGITKVMPEFIVKLPDNEIVFVYPEDSNFASGDMYIVYYKTPWFGPFSPTQIQIDILGAWLKTK